MTKLLYLQLKWHGLFNGNNGISYNFDFVTYHFKHVSNSRTLFPIICCTCMSAISYSCIQKYSFISFVFYLHCSIWPLEHTIHILYLPKYLRLRLFRYVKRICCSDMLHVYAGLVWWSGHYWGNHRNLYSIFSLADNLFIMGRASHSSCCSV